VGRGVKAYRLSSKKFHFKSENKRNFTVGEERQVKKGERCLPKKVAPLPPGESFPAYSKGEKLKKKACTIPAIQGFLPMINEEKSFLRRKNAKQEDPEIPSRFHQTHEGPQRLPDCFKGNNKEREIPIHAQGYLCGPGKGLQSRKKKSRNGGRNRSEGSPFFTPAKTSRRKRERPRRSEKSSPDIRASHREGGGTLLFPDAQPGGKSGKGKSSLFLPGRKRKKMSLLINPHK